MLMDLSLSTRAHEVIERIKKISETARTSRSQGTFVSELNRSMFDSQEILDVDEIRFPNDEVWLYECPAKTSGVRDLQHWLYSNSSISFQRTLSSAIESKCQSIKNNIDSRTFTRPKKRFSRPSLEEYKSNYYNSHETYGSPRSSELIDNKPPSIFEDVEKGLQDCNILEEEIVPKLQDKTMNFDSSASIKNKSVLENNKSTSSEPLNFDLSQPIKSSIFDRLLTSSHDVDSFQNMSPPSLVNSLCSSTFTNCSSTFTNLMENSYIKNDPILREIRDTDYSEVLLQDCESPLFHSITGSCSSSCSDTPEHFVRKNLETTFNILSKRNDSTSNSFNRSLNSTYVAEENDDEFNQTYCKSTENDNTLCNESDDMMLESEMTTFIRKSSKESMNNRSAEEFSLLSNGTVYETVKSGSTIDATSPVHGKPTTIPNNTTVTVDTNTYRKPTLQHSNTFRKSSSPRFNATFQKSSPNRTSDSFEKSTLNETVVLEPRNDNIMLTKESDANKVRRFSYIIDNRSLSPSTENLNETFNLKRNSLGPFGGSADSLDQMSSLSSSSKGSNKMLNMADVDAIVQQQERSLQQMVSTPKPNPRHIEELWEGENVSPITQVKQREPVSDSEVEKEEFHSVHSSVTKLVSVSSDTSLLSARNKQRNSPETLKSHHPRSLNTISNRNDFGIPRLPGIRKMTGNVLSKGSQPNLHGLRESTSNLKVPQSNLKMVPNTLKGSYTTLNPVCQDLLENMKAKSIGSLKVTNQVDVTKTLEEKTVDRTNMLGALAMSKDSTQVKNVVPQSNLKASHVRPSGLPRPVSMFGTGIPRPVSRIPAPKTNRPLTSRSVAR